MKEWRIYSSLGFWRGIWDNGTIVADQRGNLYDFWNYEIVSKTSNKVSSTSEWAIKIAPKQRDFATVKVTRKYADPSKAHGEQIEKFSEKFNQSASQKPMTRKKEHNFSQKIGLKTDSSQQKIHRYLQGFDEGLTLSTSSFGSGHSSSSSGSQDRRSNTFTNKEIGWR